MKGEFGFIDDIRRMFPAPAGIAGIGDDCAVIPQHNGMETLVSTDMLVEGTHFLRKDISAYQLGWKSAAANFSDIAAMGGKPVGMFLALALSRDLSDGWEDDFLHGLKDISDRFGFPLLGGDTTASDTGICVTITVLGQCPAGRSLRRSAAVDGDLVCVTGNLGDSAAGLDAVLKGIPRSGKVADLVQRHYLPVPRIAEGLELAAHAGVHAVMDISDGIASDLKHILEESGVGAEINLKAVPMSCELKGYCEEYRLDPYRFSVEGGEDYELLFTIDSDARKSLAMPHHVIGKINGNAENGVVWKGGDRDYCGYRHF